jgi:hypothetical protein
MAYNPLFQYYLINPDTNEFYTATQSTSGAWVVSQGASASPLANLPQGWQGLEIDWKRHKTYFGTFRSQTITLTFTHDGAAILYDLFKQVDSGGIEAECILRIDMWQPDFTYATVYSSEINFAQGEYDLVSETFKAGTLDSRLFTLLEANAPTQYNIPFWTYDGGWITDGFFVYHDGVNLNFNARYVTNVPITGTDIVAINSWPTAASFYSQIPLVYSQLVPYIGNDLLKNNLITGNQDAKTEQTAYDNYSQNQYLLKPITPAPTGSPVSLTATLTANFTQITYPNPSAGNQTVITFEIFQIDNADHKTSSFAFANIVFNHDSGHADFADITVTNPTVTFTPIGISVLNDHVYSLVWYFVTPGSGALSKHVYLNYDQFEINIHSNNTTSLTLNPTAPIGFKPFQLFDKLVKCLNSTTTTPNGFPIIPVGTPFAGGSAFLMTDADTMDTNPYTTLWTSGNALRSIAGQTYITTSLYDFFKTMFAVYGCGMGLNGNTLSIEKLSTFFDASTEILDLGTDISNFKINPMNEYAANHIRSGFKTQFQDFAQYVGTETSYYGIDVFNIQQDYKTPITRNKQDLDWTAPIVADAYKIELARAASNTNGGSSPSASNDNYLIETSGSVVAFPDVYDPAGNVVGVSGYGLRRYAGIQSITPGTPPYARGLTFPETMYNFGLSPARCMFRKSGLLNSICGTLQDDVIAFQKQYWQLYNGNTSISVSGIASNLDGTLITEVQDIDISALGTKLFMPYMFTFDTVVPLNMYQIINANPYGYISFKWINQYSGVATQLKGFIWSVKQKLGDSSSVSFELLAHPDTGL